VTVAVAGVPMPAWCESDALAGIGECWSDAGDGRVVCEAPGIYFAGGTVRFVLPRCYSLAPPSGSAALGAALLLCRALFRYREHGRRAVGDQQGLAALRDFGRIDAGLAWLEVALQLLEEERRNGLVYVASTDVSPHRPGRIHWPRTQRNAVHVVDGAEVATSPLWRSRYAIDPDDDLTQLHRDTCAEVRGKLGMPGIAVRRWSSTLAMSVLDRRERAMYADRHKTVARWLRTYWARTAGVANTRRTEVAALYSPHFPLVWEAMLRTVLAGEVFGLPHGTYVIDGVEQPGLRLIPDFVIDVGDVRCVVDAKHYDLASMPKSESLTKQMLYRWFASHESGRGIRPIDKVRSVFVLPVVGRGTPMVELGAHSIVEGEEAFGLGRVAVFGANFEKIVAAYGERRVESAWARSFGAT
jgi:hypothetical protein